MPKKVGPVHARGVGAPGSVNSQTFNNTGRPPAFKCFGPERRKPRSRSPSGQPLTNQSELSTRPPASRAPDERAPYAARSTREHGLTNMN